MSKTFEIIEKELAVLEGVARQSDANSSEGAAVRRAALALMFVSLNHTEQFDEFVRQADADGTADGDAYLARLRAKRR